MLAKIFKIPARFTDVTVQRSRVTNIVLKDGIAKDISSGEISGIGVRILANRWGFVSSNDIKSIYSLAQKAYKIACMGDKIEFEEHKSIKDNVKIKPKIDPAKVSIEEKKELLHRAEKEINSKEVVSTSLSYTDLKTTVEYFNSEGCHINSEYTRTAVFASVFAKKDGKLQVGSERLGGTGGIEALKGVEECAKLAAEKVVRLLDAAEAPSGNFRVLLDPKLTGVFIHEALGHAVEADHVIRGESILENKLNEQVASELVSVYDDPTLRNSFGFYFYDSEGTKARKKAVVKDGVLRTYLHSRETASKLHQENTGNARAQGYSYQPIVRMSNTYLEPGDFEFEEMLEDVKYGVYLKGSKGGEVDTARGVFQFSAEEGFLIENGKLTKPIKDVALSGKTLDILKQIDAIGKDFEMHIGFCGKEMQTVPVGDGGAHIRTFATVGGTQ